MLYVVKFLYSFILPPGLFILLLAVTFFRLWSREKRLALSLLSVTLGLYLLSTDYVGGLLIRSLERMYTPPTVLSADSIIVLGGGATADTPDFDGLGNLSGSAANRILTAARIHRQTGWPIIISGGQVYSDSGNEAEIAQRQLISLGAASGKIFVDSESLNTEQNARYTTEILHKHNLKQPLLITSAFHMKRAVMQFNKAGLRVTPYPADYMRSFHSRFYLNQLAPTHSGLAKSGTALKEYLGMLGAR